MDTLTVHLALILVTIVALVSLNKDKVAEKLVDRISLSSQQPKAKKPNQEEIK